MPETADTLQPVELADGVEIHLRVAGPAARSMAWLVDFLIFSVVLIVLGLGLMLAAAGIGAQAAGGVFLLCMFLLSWFYNVFFEMGARAATPGQRMMGLKVSSVSGAPVRLQQSMLRNLLRVIDFMPAGYLLGLLCCFFNRRFQRLGDLVADTVVIHAEPKTNATVQQVNAEPLTPPQSLTRAEQAALLEFLERAPGWSDARKVELSDLLEPLTGSAGMEGLRRACGMGLWLRQGGGRS